MQYNPSDANTKLGVMREALANIITSSSKTKFDLPVNKCKDMSCRDESLPTLIIGYENAKKYINGFSILKKYYADSNIYWTFKKNESAVDYEADLDSFYATVIKDFCDNIRYRFIDIIRINLKIAKKLINFVKSDDKKLVFNENDRFLYVYCERYATVFGFSLSTSRFFGIEPKKIMDLFKDNENNGFIYDFSIIPNKVKRITGDKMEKFIALYGYFPE